LTYNPPYNTALDTVSHHKEHLLPKRIPPIDT